MFFETLCIVSVMLLQVKRTAASSLVMDVTDKAYHSSRIHSIMETTLFKVFDSHISRLSSN